MKTLLKYLGLLILAGIIFEGGVIAGSCLAQGDANRGGKRRKEEKAERPAEQPVKKIQPSREVTETEHLQKSENEKLKAAGESLLRERERLEKEIAVSERRLKEMEIAGKLMQEDISRREQNCLEQQGEAEHLEKRISGKQRFLRETEERLEYLEQKIARKEEYLEELEARLELLSAREGKSPHPGASPLVKREKRGEKKKTVTYYETLYDAIMADDETAVDDMLGNVNGYVDTGLKEKPLHWAAMAGAMKVARYLIEKGADLNVRDRVGETALGKARIFEKKEMEAYLLQQGAEE